MTGHGAPQMGQPKRRQPKNGGLVPYRSPPFIGSWPDQTIGIGQRQSRSAAAVSTVSGKKKKPRKTKKGKGLLLGQNSPFKNVPLLNILL